MTNKQFTNVADKIVDVVADLVTMIFFTVERLHLFKPESFFFSQSCESRCLGEPFVMLYVSQTIHDQSASLNTACVLQRLYYCPEIIQFST